MNREILFRGKRVDNGEWVCGHCEEQNTPEYHAYIITDFCAEVDDRHVDILECDIHEVGPSTIGQYTGLTDKNGKRIFEGDVVRYTFDSPDDPTATENGLKPRIGRIFWSEWRASFAVTAGRKGSDAINSDVAQYVRGRGIYEYVRGANTVEIIGNIHDNPELMEV